MGKSHREQAAHVLVPLVVAIPVLAGVLGTLIDLMTSAHPHLGWAQTIASDAKAVALGRQLYSDPAEGYSGMLYTPLFPMLLAPLYRAVWWDGWPMLVSMIATMTLAGMVGAVATVRAGLPRWETVAGGVGVGGVAWWLVSASSHNLLFEGRGDHVAWLLALSGLLVLALTAAQRWRRVWPVVLLLSAAVWTKQTAIGAIVAAGAVATVWAYTGVMSWRAWRRLAAGTTVLNVTATVGLWGLSDGWGRYFLVDLPGRHYSHPDLETFARELGALLIVPALLIAVPGAALRGGLRRRSFVTLFATLIVAFIAVSLVPAWLARSKQGGEANQFLGILWAAGFLVALVHREVVRSRSHLLGAACYVGLVVVALMPGSPTLAPRGYVSELPTQVVEYARRHSVYLPSYGLVGRGVEQPQPNLIDLLAAGVEPGGLVAALEERQFDAVMLFDVRPYQLDYVAASGRTDRAYLLRLNELIERHYAPGANGAPAPLLGRR